MRFDGYACHSIYVLWFTLEKQNLKNEKRVIIVSNRAYFDCAFIRKFIVVRGDIIWEEGKWFRVRINNL